MLNIVKNFDNEKLYWDLEVTGEIDIYTSPELRDTLKSLLEEKLENIRLDCTNLDYIDSTGLGVLIGTLKKLKEQDKNIIIANPRENILKLLKITGLDKIFIMS